MVNVISRHFALRIPLSRSAAARLFNHSNITNTSTHACLPTRLSLRYYERPTHRREPAAIARYCFRHTACHASHITEVRLQRRSSLQRNNEATCQPCCFFQPPRAIAPRAGGKIAGSERQGEGEEGERA